MRISISGKNIEVSDYLQQICQKKIGKLDKYFPPETEANITLAVERNRHIVEVTIPFEGGIVRAEEVTGDMYASVDNVLKKLERQIRKHRTRLQRGLKTGVKYDEPIFTENADTGDEDDERRVVKVKHFDIKPMTVEEAMMQLELLGHSFYVFTNGNTGLMNVLYLRKDGNYGLIEPD